MSVHKIVSQQAHATVANCFFESALRDNRAFAACYSLQTIEYAGTAEQWERVQKGREWKGDGAKVYIGDKAVE